MSPADLNALVSGGFGGTAVLIFFIGLLLRGTLHTDSEHKQLKAELDRSIRQEEYWQTVAFRSLTVSEKIVEPLARQETRVP